MRERVWVLGGVIAGVLFALWFSTVVAMGPAPGSIKRSGEAMTLPYAVSKIVMPTSISPTKANRACCSAASAARRAMMQSLRSLASLAS